MTQLNWCFENNDEHKINKRYYKTWKASLSQTMIKIANFLAKTRKQEIGKKWNIKQKSYNEYNQTKRNEYVLQKKKDTDYQYEEEENITTDCVDA